MTPPRAVIFLPMALLGFAITPPALPASTVIHIDPSEPPMEVDVLAGKPIVRFSGNIAGAADRYPAFDELRNRGLILRPGASSSLSAQLEPLLGGSPVLSVRGEDAVVRFDGRWIANTGSIFSWLLPLEGGTFRIAADADFQFIRDAFYTLQLWVHGDGTGSLEIEEGFHADRTENATIASGIGSIRLSNTTLITHHSRNLPLGYRPKSIDSTQANGHLAFENAGGSRWIVRSNDQTYPGAVWIYRDLELHTETNLMHTGVTEITDYTALNGWSVFGVVITKTGPAELILAGEQSYNSGSLFQIDAGGIQFMTDPSAGQHFAGGTRDGTLMVMIATGASAAFHAPSRLASIESDGLLSITQPIHLKGLDGLWLSGNSVTELTLRESLTSAAAIRVDHSAILGGTLRIQRDSSFAPVPGTVFVLLDLDAAAGAIHGDWEIDDQSGLGLQFSREAKRLLATTTLRAGAAPGTVLLEDDFHDLSRWDDLSTVPSWGQPRRSRSAFSTVNGHVQLIRSGDDDTRNFMRYDSAAGLKTFAALDYQLAQPVDRTNAIITADLRLRWDRVTNTSGEGGRFIISFNHDYPEGGLDLTPEDQPGSKIADFTTPWWARPAYHLRLRNSNTGAGSSFLQYGGGGSLMGEYEATDDWWLPGFISGAGNVAPGSGDDFPANSWSRTVSGIASDQFLSFRYILYPDRQEVWRDDNDNGLFEPDELKAVMPLPQTSEAPLYTYFNHIEGIRLFWNGIAEGSSGDSGQVYVDSIRVTHNRTRLPIAALQLPATLWVTNGVSAGILLDGSASSHPDALPLRFQWFVNGSMIAASSSPYAAVRLVPGAHQIELRVSDATGNESRTQSTILATQGNLRPVARAGSDQTVNANTRLLAAVTLDASASYDVDGAIVLYEWSMGNPPVRIHAAANPATTVVLPVGLHTFSLQVHDNEGATGTGSMRVQVNAPGGNPPFALYRENFSRTSNGIEMGPWAVGWNLTRFDGNPVASVKWDGNAHRSLSTSSASPYLTKLNADPTGTEYDANRAHGDMWMNQMPYLNASPAEWMLWTDEFVIDTTTYEVTSASFHALDGSPERVKNSLAVRMDEQWYVFWDGRVESMWSFWRLYSIPFAASGWYLFEPGPTFSIRNATPTTLPTGNWDAFGLYFFKDYGWYVNRIDNFTINVRERIQPPPFLLWQLQHFSGADLYNDSLETTLWGADADPSHSGLSNAVRFAMGIDPWSTIQPVTLHPAADGMLALHFSTNPQADTWHYVIEQSTDLLNWIPATDFQLMPMESLPQRQLWQALVPRTHGQTSLFLRIRWIRGD